MWNLKKNINEQTKQKQTHRYREQTDGCQRGMRMGLGGGGQWAGGERRQKEKIKIKIEKKDRKRLCLGQWAHNKVCR